jgi:hypothetical protein
MTRTASRRQLGLSKLMDGLDPRWCPRNLSKTEAQRVAAVRLFFYG